VDGIPNAIDGWNLVGDKLYHVHTHCHPNHPPVPQHTQFARQVHQTEALQ